MVAPESHRDARDLGPRLEQQEGAYQRTLARKLKTTVLDRDKNCTHGYDKDTKWRTRLRHKMAQRYSTDNGQQTKRRRLDKPGKMAHTARAERQNCA
eukprot:scaffold128771_cov75-Phaeocystis_antarctica.AAC.1